LYGSGPQHAEKGAQDTVDIHFVAVFKN